MRSLRDEVDCQLRQFWTIGGNQVLCIVCSKRRFMDTKDRRISDVLQRSVFVESMDNKTVSLMQNLEGVVEATFWTLSDGKNQ